MDEDASPVQDLGETLNKLSELIEPVLEKLFFAAQNNSNLWLKKKEVKILTDWQLINAQQIQLLTETLQTPKPKIWQPGL